MLRYAERAYAPPAHTIKLAQEREITPYDWGASG
jgi:hypothetical protein